MIKVPLTVRCAALLREELKRFKTVELPAVIEANAKASTLGDLTKNAN